jgi:hypothetical protein
MVLLKEIESTTDHGSTKAESDGSTHNLDAENASPDDKDTIEAGDRDALDEAKVRAAVRKLDWTILPIMTMFYFLSFLVRCLFNIMLSFSNAPF